MEPIIITSKEALHTAVTEAVEAALCRILPEAIRRGTMKPFLTKAELMDLTGWSSRQVEYKKSRGELAFVRRNRLVLFPTDEVFAYLEEGRVPPAEKK